MGRFAEAKRHYADGFTFYPEAPTEPVSAAELIRQQQEILARNAERLQWQREYDRIHDAQIAVARQIEETQARLRQLQGQATALTQQAKAAAKTPAQLQAESTAVLEAQLRDVEAINAKVAENRRRELADDEAKTYAGQYQSGNRPKPLKKSLER